MILMTSLRRKKHERVWKTSPRVGRDAQIDGSFARLTALELEIYTPFIL